MSDAFAPGTRLGPYEIDSLIGAGGMGQVYRARDPRLGRNVAIKTVIAGATDPGLVRRFCASVPQWRWSPVSLWCSR